MECSAITDLLAALADRELESEKAERVRAHLENCPRCNKLFQNHVNVKQLLPQVFPFQKAPPELRSAILDRLESSPTSHFFHVLLGRLRAQPILASGVVVTVFLAAFASVLGLMNPHRFPPLIREVLRHHEEVYLHPLDVSTSNVGRVAKEVGLRLRRNLDVPDLKSAGLTLRGFRQCPVCLKSAVEIRYWRPPDAHLLLFVVPNAAKKDVERLCKSGYYRKKQVGGETYYYCETKSCRAIFWWEENDIFAVTSCRTLPTPFNTAKEIRRCGGEGP